MKFSVRVVALSLSALSTLPLASTGVAQAVSPKNVTGIWQGLAKVRDTEIPITIRISASGSKIDTAFLNGPADHPDVAPSTSTTLDGNHLVASFNYFARTLDATIADDTLTGTYGATHPGKRGGVVTSFTARRVAREPAPTSAPNAPNISGSWEIATKSNKGENAWELVVDPAPKGTPVLKAAIQRIDGDTGGLWGTWDGTSYKLSHFTAAGPAAYSVTPQPDGTLLVKSLLGPVHDSSAELIARRPAEARKLNLSAPTETTEQTTMKDPNAPLAFSFPDLSGKIISNTDPQFQGRVVIVAIGGSWCPNCHDEAPLLVNLYKRFHAKGLEIVNLDFEQGDPETDISRLKAFIEHYGITYPVVLAGTTDQLNDKIPQAVNLNCWPTAFFVGRDGLVKEIHAGFAGPGNTAGHIALEHEVTSLVEKLLSQHGSAQSAKLN